MAERAAFSESSNFPVFGTFTGFKDFSISDFVKNPKDKNFEISG
jgi:hypothetical protein